MLKTYLVFFVNKHGFVNKMLLKSTNLHGIYDYMHICGNTVVRIEEQYA